MTAELQRMKDGEYNSEVVQKVMEWIGEVLQDDLLKGVAGHDGVHEKLKDGVLLCKLINEIKPGSVKKINYSKLPFQMMKNTVSFNTGNRKWRKLSTAFMH